MSIAIIRRPQPLPSTPSDQLGIPAPVISQLVARAASAGKVISLRTCRLQSELVDCLRSANDAHFEFVMFDPGEWVGDRGPLKATLAQLRMPYIEVHDDHSAHLEPALPIDCGPRMCLVQGYCSQGYNLALSTALEHLGCSGCENHFHVGT